MKLPDLGKRKVFPLSLLVPTNDSEAAIFSKLSNVSRPEPSLSVTVIEVLLGLLWVLIVPDSNV